MQQESSSLRYYGLVLVPMAFAWAVAGPGCTPDKVKRGITSSGGGVSGGIVLGEGGSASGGAGGGVAGITGHGGVTGTGGYTYVPPSAGGAGGTGTVTWTTVVTTKDAAVASVCKPAVAPTTGPQHQILISVKQSNSVMAPGTEQTMIKSHLEARGFKVDYAFIYTSTYKTDAGSFTNVWFLDDAKTKMVDMSQYGLAIVFKDGYNKAANLDTIPVLCGNNQTADTYLGMASTDGTTSSTKSAFKLINPAHPIAAEKTGDSTGTVVLETGTSASMKIMVATVPTTAHIVGIAWESSAPGTSTAALFAYDVGDTLANGTAAKARRVGFPLDDSTTWGLVTAGSVSWEFFDASVDWLLGLVPCSGGSTSSNDASVVDTGAL